MQYKGFIARYYYAPEAALYVAEIINCKDLISFGAQTFDELFAMMKDAVESYLASCGQNNDAHKEPLIA